MTQEKEYLYVGHYWDVDHNYILKIGTTNNLCRRQTEHTRNYRRAKINTMPAENQFVYDWYLPLSKYNTLRYEDKNRQAWIDQEVGKFVRNDRFCCAEKPRSVVVRVRKEYEVFL